MSKLINLIDKTQAKIGIIGLGYVGLPLTISFVSKAFQVTGFDIDQEKVNKLNNKKSYIKHINDKEISNMIDSKLFHATNDFSKINNIDILIICVPTPINKYKEPDLNAVIQTAKIIKQYIRDDQMIILESSSYPGTTDELLKPILEESGLFSDKDFYIAYSPEREDPGNKKYSTQTIPKIVGANSKIALSIAVKLYGSIINEVIPVNSTKIAEASKLTENIFRSINIALVNELKIIFNAMGIDVWDVIEAASSKPFGYMPFYPGPGLGGHCIPVDPFYLSYKAKEFNVDTKFIELAGEMHTKMPEYVISNILKSISLYSKKRIDQIKILVIGVAYKKDVDDYRESPSLIIIDMLEALGANILYHDDYVPEIKVTREHPNLAGRKSEKLTNNLLMDIDIVLILTDHSYLDYEFIANNSKLIVDTRNAMKGVNGIAKIIKS